MARKKAAKKAAKKSSRGRKRPLTEKQQLYVAARVAGMSPRAAADEAGYQDPPSDRRIREAIALQISERLDVLGIKGDDVVRRLAQVAFANLTDVVHIDESDTGCVFVERTGKDGETYMEHAGSNSVRITATDAWGEQHKAAARSIKQTKDGVEVRFSDQLKALEILAKHFGVLEQTTEINADQVVVLPAKSGEIADWQGDAQKARELSLRRMSQEIG
jgi:phage terminase small subunit